MGREEEICKEIAELELMLEQKHEDIYKAKIKYLELMSKEIDVIPSSLFRL